MNQKKLGILVLAGCLVGIPAMFLGIAYLVVDETSEALTVTLHPGDDWTYSTSEPMDFVMTDIYFGFTRLGDHTVYCYPPSDSDLGVYFVTIDDETIIVEVVEPNTATPALIAAIVLILFSAAAIVLLTSPRTKEEEFDE